MWRWKGREEGNGIRRKREGRFREMRRVTRSKNVEMEK